ncbi:beta strand repeat-containing protein [Prochlorococcus marinus]|uniref:beta strand repeat-containing protein n=1 Tax=Prochlorococcus marinus TaxID=1219 RepID=UPI0012DAC53D|nr:hypothetical protein [Prochlorococcus marinus]
MTADLFVLQTANEVTVFGLDGADTVTAQATVGNVSAIKLNVGKGADSVVYTGAGGNITQGSIFGGAGHDTLNLSTSTQTFASSVARGGQGNDTIFFQGGSLNDSTVNGNDLSDIISASIQSGSNTSLIAGGKGSDTITFTNSGSDAITVNGGAGHDTINIVGLDNDAVGGLSSFVVDAGAGKDTVTFNSSTLLMITASSNIQGGNQADLLRFGSAGEAQDLTVAGTATIGGGEGADTIIFEDNVFATASVVQGGAGADSIHFDNQGSAWAIGVKAGAGKDSITFSAFAASGVLITSAVAGVAGGANADTFSLGSRTITNQKSGSEHISGGGTILRYDAFSESTLAETDVVSAGFTFVDNASGGTTVGSDIFRVSQDAVSASVQNVEVANFSGTNSITVFTSTFSEAITARVEALDNVLTKGQIASFHADDGATDYIFVQGGAAAGGTSDDLLIQMNTAATVITVDDHGATNDSSFTVGITTAFA